MAVPYTTRDRVREVLARAGTPDPGTAASLSDERVDDAILAASGRIDAHLSRLYSVPFAANAIPGLVADIATAFAAYDLDMTFREVRDYSSELNPVILRYRQAADLLRDLREGTATLPDYTPPEGEDPDDLDAGSIVGIYAPELPNLSTVHHPIGCDCCYYGRCL